MKYVIALLLLAFSTSLAYAEVTIPISCDNVTKISVDQLKASDLNFIIEEDPYVYFITLWLNQESATKYKKAAAKSIITAVKPDGTYVIKNQILLLTPLGVIKSDAPYQTTINSRQLILFMKTKKKAFVAAQQVCPKIKPKVFFLYDYLEEQRLKGKQD